MEINVNGVCVNKNSCTATPFKFGKTVDDLPNVSKMKYTISLGINFLKERFEIVFDDFVEDYRRDDELYPGQEDNLLLRKKGYPKLQSLIHNDTQFLSKFIIDNLGLELIDCILGKDNKEIDYVICNIVDIIISQYNVSIIGDCIKYQGKQGGIQR